MHVQRLVNSHYSSNPKNATTFVFLHGLLGKSKTQTNELKCSYVDIDPHQAL